MGYTLQMWRFYWETLKRIPKSVWEARKTAAGWVTGVLALAALVSKELGERLQAQWQGLPRWCVVLPVGILVLRELFKINYERYQKIEVRNGQLEEERKPRLQLIFEPQGSHIQERFDGSSSQPGWGVGSSLLFRVRVKNESKTQTIENVQARLENIDPNPGFTFLPECLRIMNAPKEKNRSLNPGDDFFVDVAEKANSQNLILVPVLVYDTGWPSCPADHQYRVTIVATAKNVPEVREDFIFGAGADGVLRFDRADRFPQTQTFSAAPKAAPRTDILTAGLRWYVPWDSARGYFDIPPEDISSQALRNVVRGPLCRACSRDITDDLLSREQLSGLRC